MGETSVQRESRIQSMDDSAARSLSADVGNAAFDILEQIGGPDTWLGDHEHEVTITMSVADWSRVFTSLQLAAAQEESMGFPKGALDNAYLAMEIAAELAASKRPLTAPAA